MADYTPEEQRELSIVLSNKYAQSSRRTFTVAEEHALGYICSLIQPELAEGKYQLEYIFDIKDFCVTCGIDWESGKNYEATRETLQRLRNRSFWMPIEDGKGETLVGWLDRVTIVNNVVFLKIDDRMAPYLFGLNQFIKYQLNEVLMLRSVYSIRLFQLLLSWRKKKEVEIDLEELKHLLNCDTQKSYVAFDKFKEKVLNKAVKEINERSVDPHCGTNTDLRYGTVITCFSELTEAVDSQCEFVGFTRGSQSVHSFAFVNFDFLP